MNASAFMALPEELKELRVMPAPPGHERPLKRQDPGAGPSAPSLAPPRSGAALLTVASPAGVHADADVAIIAEEPVPSPRPGPLYDPVPGRVPGPLALARSMPTRRIMEGAVAAPYVPTQVAPIHAKVAP